jgi:hypothetical protein
METLRKKFELYDTLDSTKKLTAAERKSLQGKVDALDEERKKAVVLLIAEYALRNGWDGKGIPCGGIQVDSNVEYMDKLPQQLESVLYSFVK